MNQFTPAHILEVYRRCITPSGAPPMDSEQSKKDSERQARNAKLRARYEHVA